MELSNSVFTFFGSQVVFIETLNTFDLERFLSPLAETS